MPNKPFAIQGSTLTIGGVDLQAGSNGVVIPGVTRAATFKVEEVDERDGSNPDIFGSNEGAVTVIDNAEYLYLVDDGDVASNSYVAAEYSVGELDDGEIHEINVESAGVFAAADKTRVEAANMWATTTPTPFATFNPNNWTQIPYRPKIQANLVENIGGGGGSGDRLTNGDYQVVLGSSGNITIPKNSTISITGSTNEDRYGGDINITGQRGYGNWSTTGNAGWGSSIYIRSGDGGENSIPDQGGEGGEVWIRSGDGQAGENGGKASLIAGNARYNNDTNPVYGGNVFVTAGNATEYNDGLGHGGNVNITAGQGDQANGVVNITTQNSDNTDNIWTFAGSVLNLPSTSDIKRGGISVLLSELEIDGGNANTPELGELIIDGNNGA
jgi:hypothetical protein